MKFPHRYKVYDVLHKTGVYTSISIALLLAGKLVFDAQYYIRKQRPKYLEENRLKKEQELASKQLEKEQELLVQERLQEKTTEVLKG